jgi:hypothetical protein
MHHRRIDRDPEIEHADRRGGLCFAHRLVEGGEASLGQQRLRHDRIRARNERGMLT